MPNHEFPQPFDLTVREDDILTPAASSMTFLQSSTFLMVGQIPVEFGKLNVARLFNIFRLHHRLHHSDYIIHITSFRLHHSHYIIQITPLSICIIVMVDGTVSIINPM